MNTDTITLPKGTRCRISMRQTHYLIVIAPPGQEPTTDAFFAAPTVVAMFSHDPGTAWPDRDGCRWATEYLKTEHSVVFQFQTMADTLTAHKRLLASRAGS